jgi:hypothetical protein
MNGLDIKCMTKVWGGKWMRPTYYLGWKSWWLCWAVLWC